MTAAVRFPNKSTKPALPKLDVSCGTRNTPLGSTGNAAPANSLQVAACQDETASQYHHRRKRNDLELTYVMALTTSGILQYGSPANRSRTGTLRIGVLTNLKYNITSSQRAIRKDTILLNPPGCYHIDVDTLRGGGVRNRARQAVHTMLSSAVCSEEVRKRTQYNRFQPTHRPLSFQKNLSIPVVSSEQASHTRGRPKKLDKDPSRTIDPLILRFAMKYRANLSAVGRHSSVQQCAPCSDASGLL